MKKFSEFIAEGKVKTGSKDPAEARSLFEQAQNRLIDVKNIKLTEQNAAFRFEDIYECMREALQAFMAVQGYKPYSHEAVIAFAQENKLITEAESAALDRYRTIRNDITYRGEKTTTEETAQALNFAEQLLNKLKTNFKQAI